MFFMPPMSLGLTRYSRAGGSFSPASLFANGIEWTDFGLTAEDIAPVLAGLIVDVRPAEQAGGHFDDVLAANGLARFEEELAA